MPGPGWVKARARAEQDVEEQCQSTMVAYSSVIRDAVQVAHSSGKFKNEWMVGSFDGSFASFSRSISGKTGSAAMILPCG